MADKMRRLIVRLVKSALARRNRVLIPAMENLGRPRYFSVLQSEYTNEYVRLSQLDLAVHEIKTRNVRGEVAEVGVYQGHFSAILNRAFPDRKLYLFDTFEGFDGNQEQSDRQKHGLTYIRDFTDTSVGVV
jgi:O-methyltransferase